MTWYFSELARFKSEREALEQFGLTHEWFVFGQWRFDDRMRLILDADIIAGGRTWPIYLQFPDLFPHTPPSVFPRGDTSRWSSHQYGSGGELCLEYGPDNWTTDLTGVHVIESTYRLLQGENPAPDTSGNVPSRHLETMGRRLRTDILRFLLTRAATEALAVIPEAETRVGTVAYAYHKEAIVFVLAALKSNVDERVWRPPDVPSQLSDEYFEREVKIIRLVPEVAAPPTTPADGFRSALGLPSDGEPLVLVLKGADIRGFWLRDKSISEIPIIFSEPEVRRTEAAHDILRDKKVGLVGCGSLGSKIGAMLTRAGVANWLLVDDDLLLPENFVRNELDWRDAGSHKAPALARRMEYINPGIETTIWKVQLASQTASASAETILGLLGGCDLIIDATANPDALNILSAVTLAKKKPMIWAEVFGGGIGGLMARYRPGLEPSPQLMRRAIENWFADQSAPPVRSARSYEAVGDDAPLIASDADVSVIAANAARFAIDLLARDASSFPHSVYAIGLSAGSVFTEPFDTRPIEVDLPTAEVPQRQLDTNQMQAELATLLSFLNVKNDETAASGNGHQTSTP